ncbi:M23 family metallopeptidase [Streptomyces sp. VRA16 Mangrove soil]|uniref:M23 family metallopeptidase n=1 Tax=Streptomyces sp. VRA16 Mangrove soil TaxID=2817434 RepID=UPI001A9CDCF1|nr:M23 family metallopeptidase [Streptomyces sp. VRA16 Mangrove soil]MBO1329709.1 peptidoglycan DD-metalloendopeptidase family protein [Streptomyces sp. VRA16 Mangrove soil]
MPAKGKHRRPKSQRVTRAAAVATVGGAALVLPLVGAAGAQAADSGSTTTTYTVKSGDTLAKIAKSQGVDGGWKQLYQDNQDVIGSNAALIKPGTELTVDGSASGASATATRASDTTSSSGYVKPVDGSVGTPYHSSGSMWSSGYHTGTDFTVSTGTSVKAVAQGTVVSAGYDGSYGNEIVIKNADGYYAQYAHLSSVGVSAGQTVNAGDRIGLSGATGNVTGPHLHFEIRTTASYGSDVDPLAYLRSHGVTV